MGMSAKPGKACIAVGGLRGLGPPDGTPSSELVEGVNSKQVA